jgi:hypothetical protein
VERIFYGTKETLETFCSKKIIKQFPILNQIRSYRLWTILNNFLKTEMQFVENNSNKSHAVLQLRSPHLSGLVYSN